jgi:two-component system CheB/CheR fusion protein
LNASKTVAEAMHIQLAAEQNYLAVCIDENNMVVKSYGNTKYLNQGHFNLNFPELLPKPLAVAFNTLTRRVNQTGEPAMLSGIKIKHEGAAIKVTLVTSRLKVNKNDPKLLMVTICKDAQPAPLQQNDAIFDEKIYHDQYTLNLEEELKELQVKLHSAYERLDASNENMQSFNEELISANEEMQSTNEEMQSVNEERHTINADYQLKNKELLEINDDLNNYFRSNINGQLFINNDLLLMKFSPGTVKQINLLETDIGRPLSNISTNIKFETIIDDIKQVLAEGTIITKEIETNNGKWYQIMTMPYIQSLDQKRNGAIVTFNDITELKATQVELNRKNKSLERINADLDNFVHTASHDLLAPLANIETSIGVMNLIKVTDPALSKFITIINSSVKKFRTLINEISVIARIEGNMLTLEMVDLEEVIANVEWSLESRIKETGALITKNIGIKQVLFSKKNMRSILFNLVANGINYTDGKVPLIHIAIKKSADQIMISVSDHGIGIAKNQVDHIFSMYGRVNEEGNGKGIGLYLAKKIIHAANGTITLESELNKGSTFCIQLPLQATLVDSDTR